jgi:dual oxidase
MFTDDDLNDMCRKELSNDTCERQNNFTTFNCYHLPQIDTSNVEDCTEPETYDYFSNSEISFILTFTGVAVLILGKK